MKKSKVILALVLAVVFVITCMNVPTFSWFTRPREAKGESMVLQTKNEYTAYNGNGVKISTSTSSDGGDTYGPAETTNYSGTDINPYSRKYFCTTITNESGKDQNVSLYASKLSIPKLNNGTLALGVNGPTRSYRNYTALAQDTLKTTKNEMRIYFENNYNVDGWKDKDKWYYICWNDGNDSLDGTGTNGNYYLMTKTDSNHYYADIPSSATHAFFAVQDWGTNDNGNPNYGQRTEEVNLVTVGQTQKQSYVFKLENKFTSYNNPQVTPYKVNGACINSYYSTISVPKGSTFDAKLKSGEYIGSIKYYYAPENAGIFTVDKDSGLITAKSPGEAILYTKVTGPYGDDMQVETLVKVTATANYEFTDVPIVRNIKISGEVGDTENPKNVVKVYWYVINNSKTNTLNYTIDNIYLGL